MENGFCPENKTTSKVRDDRKHLSVYYSIAYYQQSWQNTRVVTSGQFKESTSEIRGDFAG